MIIKSLIYGIVQGLCEFLPISSSGHLAILHILMGGVAVDDSLTFDLFLHLGTLAAVFVVYRKDIAHLIIAFFTLVGKLFGGNFHYSSYTADERMVICMLIASLPLIPAAFLENYVEAVSANLLALGIIFIINSIMLFLSDFIPAGDVGEDDFKPKNALIIGLSQIIAIFPGLSRSGTTVTAGLTQKLDRAFAVKFSFLMSIPTILGGCLLKIPDFIETAGAADKNMLISALIGALAAALVGAAAMKLLTLVAKIGKFGYFAIYTAMLGTLSVALYLFDNQF